MRLSGGAAGRTRLNVRRCGIPTTRSFERRNRHRRAAKRNTRDDSRRTRRAAWRDELGASERKHNRLGKNRRGHRDRADDRRIERGCGQNGGTFVARRRQLTVTTGGAIEGLCVPVILFVTAQVGVVRRAAANRSTTNTTFAEPNGRKHGERQRQQENACRYRRSHLAVTKFLHQRR